MSVVHASTLFGSHACKGLTPTIVFMNIEFVFSCIMHICLYYIDLLACIHAYTDSRTTPLLVTIYS